MHSLLSLQHNDKTVVCIVFHGDALSRMQSFDPAIIQGELMSHMRVADGNPFGHLMHLQHVDFMFAYHEDEKEFADKCRELGSRQEVLKWLVRGWQNMAGDETPIHRVDVFHPEAKQDDRG